jgi:dihydrofolate reductase
MGKIVVSEFVSLDGVIEDPGGAESYEHGGWSFKFDRGPEGDKYKFDELMAAEAMLLGRVTYEAFAQAWPSMTDEVGFADKMNGAPKYVVSTTIENPNWGPTTVISGDLPGEVAKAKAAHDGDILVGGSAQLVHALTEHDLVDEYRLMVFPIVLGSGKRIFSDAAATPSTLRLTDTKPVGPDGVIVLTYEPARADA